MSFPSKVGCADKIVDSEHSSDQDFDIEPVEEF